MSFYRLKKSAVFSWYFLLFVFFLPPHSRKLADQKTRKSIDWVDFRLLHYAGEVTYCAVGECDWGAALHVPCTPMPMWQMERGHWLHTRVLSVCWALGVAPSCFPAKPMLAHVCYEPSNGTKPSFSSGFLEKNNDLLYRNLKEVRAIEESALPLSILLQVMFCRSCI